MDKTKLKMEFSKRLNEAADALGWGNSRDNSRVQKLRSQLPFKISQPAVRKWFVGESVPDATNIGYVANVMNVNLVWLATGNGSKDTGKNQLPDLIKETKITYSKKIQLIASELARREKTNPKLLDTVLSMIQLVPDNSSVNTLLSTPNHHKDDSKHN